MEEIQAYDDSGYYTIMLVPLTDLALNDIDETILEEQRIAKEEWERDQWLDAYLDGFEPIHDYKLM